MNPFLIYILIFFLFTDLSQSKSLEVGSGKQFEDLPQAVAISEDGDTIIVNAGIYKVNNLRIIKKIVIKGKKDAILDANNKANILLINSDSVRIEGLTFRNVKASYIEDFSAIKILKSSYCVIENNKVLNSFFGIYCEYSNNCIIKNNKIIGEAKEEFSSANAIHLWYCNNMTIADNTTSQHRDGIYFEFVKNSKISNNNSNNNLRYGLHFMFSDSNTYVNNIFSNNGAGVAVMYSSHIYMHKNKFYDNIGQSSYGLLLKEITDSQITDNEIAKNTTGIYADGTTRCNIIENNFKRNGLAIKIYGSSTSNIFTKNNFISNTFDVSSNASDNRNDFYMNYWEKYSGYDINKDGYGDIPYYPVRLFSYITAKSKEALILLHSFFIKILEFAESIFPFFTPTDLKDPSPLMKPYYAKNP